MATTLQSFIDTIATKTASILPLRRLPSEPSCRLLSRKDTQRKSESCSIRSPERVNLRSSIPSWSEPRPESWIVKQRGE
jgi:hypothetical protein